MGGVKVGRQLEAAPATAKKNDTISWISFSKPKSVTNNRVSGSIRISSRGGNVLS